MTGRIKLIDLEYNIGRHVCMPAIISSVCGGTRDHDRASGALFVRIRMYGRNAMTNWLTHSRRTSLIKSSDQSHTDLNLNCLDSHTNLEEPKDSCGECQGKKRTAPRATRAY